MTVDEKGLAAGIEAAKESMADRDNHWEVALAVIQAYEAAKTAEGAVVWRWRPKGSVFWIYDPDMDWLAQQGDDIDKQPLYPALPRPRCPMSEIDEETIARAILHEEYGCAPEDATNLYAKALSTGRLVMALVLPAIERARVEERERCAKVADNGTTYITSYGQERRDFSNVSIAAAIRKG